MSYEEQVLRAMQDGFRTERWHALTPFEQQVGLALGDHLIRGDSVADCPVSSETLKLAPRVAAAIEAAAPDMIPESELAAQVVADYRARKIAAAVAALRGTDA